MELRKSSSFILMRLYKTMSITFFVLILIPTCVGYVPLDNINNNDPLYLHRAKRATSEETQKIRNMSPLDRPNCKPGATVPNIRVDTTQRLADLRAKFKTNGLMIHGYYIPSEDAHNSEYPSSYDKRRGFISGLSGSAGRAVVLDSKAALWTDGRYFLQAEDELDCNWILMKMGTGDPSITEWVKANLLNGQKLGADPFLITSSSWTAISQTLNESGIQMEEVQPDLIDQIWTTNRPAQPNSPVNALPIKFAGKTWQDKITDMHAAMEVQNVDIMIVTSLDETAWLFNLRASDIEYNPFFLSYAIVDRSNNKTTLYMKDFIKKLTATPTDEATTENIQTHLNTGADGTCASRTGMCVQVKEYERRSLLTDIQTAVSGASGQIWVSYSCNYAIYSKVLTTVNNNDEKIHQANTPAAIQKAQKNEIEKNGMIQSHIRDAVALITFMAKLEKEVKKGKHWTEVSAAAELKQFRKRQKYNRGLSFASISSVGSNAAVIHYVPSNATDKTVTTREVYLLDSGGQYLDGTTDVTRTFHFGSPTEFERECYTRVLMGHVDLADLTITEYRYGRELDIIARRHLWDVGLDYRHGTGHGVGMYLSVHEGPGSISMTSRLSIKGDEYLKENQFFSDEPGYYEDGEFGMRLENVFVIKKADTTYHFPGKNFLQFDTVTMVPYEPNLIKKELLTEKQVDWINAYHAKVQSTIGPLIANDAEASEWLSSRTKMIQVDQVGMASNTVVSLTLLITAVGFYTVV